MFTHKRTNVPFMMKGKCVIKHISNELMSNVDIVPTVLNLCGLQNNSKMDGSLLKDFGGDKKEFVITESIFPGQTYKLAINDKEHLFMFETDEKTRNDGMIPVSEYRVKLIKHITKEDETQKYSKKLDKYNEIVFNHIKEWISFNK